MPGVTNELAVGLPPLNEARRAVWDSYRIEFLPDGYPGKRTDDGVRPHPIYGPYVITDYLQAYGTSHDPHYLEAAKHVADAAIDRMESLGEALVFMYDPADGISSQPERFFSGLTQSRYLQVLSRLTGVSRGSRFRRSAQRVLQGLLLPAEQGGVLRRTPGGGAAIDDYPHAVPNFTLNSWLSATLLVDEYARTIGDDDAAALVERSRAGLHELLPLYDVPELATSRYRLVGQANLRLRFERPDMQIHDATLVVPRQGEYPIVLDGDGSRENRLDRSDPQAVRLQVTLSRTSWPSPNRVRVTLTAPAATTVSLGIGKGVYRPTRSSLRVDGYEAVSRAALDAGRQTVELEVPWNDAELVAYPTHFGRKSGDKVLNQYHFIHADTLKKLDATEPDDVFRYYSRRWLDYPHRWPELPEYQDESLVLARK